MRNRPSVIQQPARVNFPPPDASDKKFNRRLVDPIFLRRQESGES